jgi:choline dehydrogenase-like flavoprotein
MVRDHDELEDFVRNRFELLYHPVGTCRMGSTDQGVVDSDLRVHGISSLRVADASVMPRIVSGNTNAATMMIGARLVEKILGG